MEGPSDFAIMVRLNSTNVTVENNTIRSDSQDATGVVFINQSNGTIVRNNTFPSIERGVYIEDAESTLIADNHIIINASLDNRNFAISLFSSANNNITNNTILVQGSVTSVVLNNSNSTVLQDNVINGSTNFTLDSTYFYNSTLSPITHDGTRCDSALYASNGTTFYNIGVQILTDITPTNNRTNSTVLTGTSKISVACINGTGIGGNERASVYLTEAEAIDDCDEFEATAGAPCYAMAKDIFINSGQGGAYTYNSTALDNPINASSISISAGYDLTPTLTLVETTTAKLQDHGVKIHDSCSGTYINNNFHNSTAIDFIKGGCNSTKIYNNSLGQITWNALTNLTFKSNLIVNTNIFLQQNLVGLETNANISSLNTTAEIEIRNLTYISAPKLLKDSTRCDDTNACNISYDSTNGILYANVSGFSNYSTQSINLTVTIDNPTATWYNSNFTINVTTGGEVNSTEVTYKVVNLSSNLNLSGEVSLSNTSITSWNASFDATTYGDGNYTFVINATDGTTVNNTENVTIGIDVTSPTIHAITIESITTTGGNLTANVTDSASGFSTCNYTGAGIGNLSYTTSAELVNATLSGLTAGTAYTVNVTCTDNAENSQSNTTSFTTTAAAATESDSSSSSSSSSSGGSPATGSSGGITVPSSSSSKTIWSVIYGGEKAIAPGQENLGVEEIVFIVSKDVKAPQLKIESTEALPAEITTFQKKIYRISKISSTNLKEEDLDSVIIKFNVEKSWLADYDLSKDDLAMFRFTEKWEELTTTLTGEDNNHFYYEAETPGFSYFLIGEKEQVTNQPAEVKQDPANEAVEKETASTGDNAYRFSYWHGIIIALALIVTASLFAYFFRKSRKR